MRYGIGDIVKMKTANGNNTMNYFVIIDVFLEFSKDVNKFSFQVDDENTRYTAMQIYPVEKEEHMLFRYNTTQFDLVALVGQEQHEVIIDLVKRERKRQGKTNTPFYEEVIRKRVNGEAFDKLVSNTPYTTWTTPSDKKKGKKKKVEVSPDIIQYDKLATVDECLDAMNDLTNLHKTFGDESYLQLREVVVGRLKDLSDIIKKAKSVNWDKFKNQ